MGVGDQDIHEVFVASAAGSDAFARDLLAGRARSHPTVVWWLLGGLRAVGVPPLAGYLGVHLLSLFAMGWVVASLGRLLTPGRQGVWLASVLAVAPAQAALGGAPTLDALFLPRGAALPLELGVVLLFLAGARRRAFGLGGMALLVHAPSAVATLAGLGGAWLLDRSDRRAPLAAIPGALLALALASGADLSTPTLDPDAWALVRARLGHHLDPSRFPPGAWVVAVAWAGATWGASRSLGAPHGRALGGLLAGLLGWALLAGGAGPLLRLRLLLNLEPWQALRLVMVLGAVLVSHVLAGRSRGLVGAWVLVCLLLSPRPWWRTSSDVMALAHWAREHTEPQDLFVLPPDVAPGFRVRSQRPVFGTWKDGGEGQFSARFAESWSARMRSLSGLQEPPRRRDAVAAGYAERPLPELLRVAREAGADWLVVPRREGVGESVAGWSVLRVHGLGGSPGAAPP